MSTTPVLLTTFYFLASSAAVYVALRVGLSVLLRLLRGASNRPEVIDLIVWPSHVAIIAGTLHGGLALFFADLPITFLFQEIFKTLFFLSLAWLAVRIVMSFIHGIYIEEANVPVPELLKGAVSIILYGGTALGVLHFYFDVDMTNVLIGAAVVGAIAGIVLQNTLKSLLAGISLSLDDAFHVGELVRVADFTGVVEDTNWRTTQLRSEYDDHVTIPNEKILDLPMINFHRPDPTHRSVVRIPVSAAAAPNQVKTLLAECALMAEGVLSEPAPEVLLDDYKADTLTYAVRFWITDYAENRRIENEIRTVAWYRLRRTGVAAAAPPEKDVAKGAEKEIHDHLAAVPLFAALKPEHLTRLAALARIELFGGGERLFRGGDPGDSFYVVQSGRISISLDVPNPAGRLREQRVATITAGGFFGERSLLTGESRTAHARALDDSELIVIDKDAFQEILLADENAAGRISEIVVETQRRDAERTSAQAAPEAPKESPEQAQENLLAKIKSFFELS